MMLYNYQIYFPLMPCQTKIFRLPPNTGKSDYQSCRPILSTFHEKSHTMHNMHIIIKMLPYHFTMDLLYNLLQRFKLFLHL